MTLVSDVLARFIKTTTTKLSTRLILLFLLLSIIPLSVVGYLAYVNGQRTIEQNTVNHLLSTTILKEAELNLWIEDSERSLQALARSPLIREYADVLASPDPPVTSGQDPAHPEYQAAHNNFLEDHLIPTLEEERGWLELFLIQASDGLILVSTNEKQEGKYKESNPYFVEGKKHTYVKNVYYSLTLEEVAMVISTPVYDPGGYLVAVLAGRVDLDQMSEIMRQGRDLRSTEETYLVNKFNFFVTESRFTPGSALKKAIRTEGVEDCLQHKDGAGLYDDYRGVPIIGAYRWIPERELCILTEIDQAEAFAPVVALRNTALGTAAAVALVVAALAVLFSRTITGPVLQLVKGAVEFGQGKLDYRIEVSARDEIGQLATAFNTMAAERKLAEDELKKHQEHLEELVEERTAELTRANEELEQEIAERTRAEELVQASLREKEVLLKEIHHRVKNNMQVIVSLLNLQAAQVQNEEALEVIRESQSRVRSMALVHERLYQSPNLAEVDFSGYVQQLTRHLFSLYKADSTAVKPLVDAEDIYLGVDLAIPCGLIINELISNSLKHAFPGERTGELRIELRQEGDTVILEVGDNGVGLPQGLDWQNTESLGLQLLVMLTGQLDGEIELDRSNGTTFKITFPGIHPERS